MGLIVNLFWSNVWVGVSFPAFIKISSPTLNKNIWAGLVLDNLAIGTVSIKLYRKRKLKVLLELSAAWKKRSSTRIRLLIRMLLKRLLSNSSWCGLYSCLFK